MSTSLQDKIALVTGGTHGIGRAIAERFARDGAVVGVSYAHDEAAAQDTVDGIRSEGGRAFAVRAELGVDGDAASLWSAFDDAGKAWTPDGGLDVLVHNAAKGSFSRLDALTEEAFDEVFAVSVKAPFFITKLGLPRLREGGRIINISSIAATLATPETIAYSAGKAALNAFTRGLAKELGPRGITVNSVSPGITLTRNNSYLQENEEAAARAAERVALGRLGRTDDVADVVAFLAGEGGRWVTGQVIDASGGTAL